MSEQQTLEAIVKSVIAVLGDQSNTAPVSHGNKLGVADYPLVSKRPELVRTPTGKKLDELTLGALRDGKVTPEDMRIAPETLEMQAQVAEAAGRAAFARNLRRAAELIAVPDERVLEIYNAMRPNRSSKAELLAIADELQNQYQASINSAFVREAAEVYEARGILRKD